MSKVLNLKKISPDADKYVRDCKLHREHIKICVLAEKCGFEVKTGGYAHALTTYNDAVYESEYSNIDEESRGMIVYTENTKLIAIDENQSLEYKRFVGAYLLCSYLLNEQPSEIYLDVYVDDKLKKDISKYAMELLVPEEFLKPKLFRCDFDDLMMYFKVPDFVLREKVLKYRKKVNNNEVI